MARGQFAVVRAIALLLLLTLATNGEEAQCVDGAGESAAGEPPAEEEAEAVAASTVLLQSAARHSRKPRAGEEAVGSLSLAEAAGARSRYSVSELLQANPFPQIIEKVLASIDLPTSDPFWGNMTEEIRRACQLNPRTRNFLRLCRSNDLVNYTKSGCSPTNEGSYRVNGTFFADAYYCGSRAIDWSKVTHPVTDICSAGPSTAYNPDGHCGRYSKKQLVVNVVKTVPKWRNDAHYINIPSLDCVLGLGDCDIYYCQTCPGRCA